MNQTSILTDATGAGVFAAVEAPLDDALGLKESSVR
jgi:hypothetical protein